MHTFDEIFVSQISNFHGLITLQSHSLWSRSDFHKDLRILGSSDRYPLKNNRIKESRQQRIVPERTQTSLWKKIYILINKVPFWFVTCLKPWSGLSQSINTISCLSITCSRSPIGGGVQRIILFAEDYFNTFTVNKVWIASHVMIYLKLSPEIKTQEVKV